MQILTFRRFFERGYVCIRRKYNDEYLDWDVIQNLKSPIQQSRTLKRSDELADLLEADFDLQIDGILKLVFR